MNIRQNIEDGKYENKVQIVGSSFPPKLLRDIEGKKVKDLSVEELNSLPKLRAEFEEQKKLYAESLALHRKEEGRVLDLFESDCAEAEGVSNNPKRASLWGKAWEHGHSAGFSEVWNIYQDLAELIK